MHLGSRASRTIRDLAGLEALAEPWSLLVRAQRGAPSDGFLWSKAAAQTFERDYTLSLRVLDDGARLAAIAPLAQRHGQVPRLEMLGVTELSEPTDFVYRDRAALEELVGELLADGVPLFLKRVPADSPTVRVLSDRCNRRGLALLRPAGSTPWLPLDDGAKEPEERFNAGRRSDLRRLRRKAEAQGKVEVRILSPTEEEVEDLLLEAFAVEDHSWKGRAGSSMLRDQRSGAFFRAYATLAAQAGTLRIGLLHIAGKPAAMQLAVEDRGRLSLLKIGYDDAQKACSPGTLLLLEAVRDAMRRGLEGVDFLGTEAPWTKAWTERARPCVAVRAYPAGLRSAVLLATEGAEHSWHRLKERLTHR